MNLILIISATPTALVWFKLVFYPIKTYSFNWRYQIFDSNIHYIYISAKIRVFCHKIFLNFLLKRTSETQLYIIVYNECTFPIEKIIKLICNVRLNVLILLKINKNCVSLVFKKVMILISRVKCWYRRVIKINNYSWMFCSFFLYKGL